MKNLLFSSAVFVCLACFCLEFGLISTANATTNTPPATTMPDTCSAHNGSCEKCVSFPGAKCFYCETTKICAKYPAQEIFPTKYCALSEARWGVCFLNFEALIIAMGVIGGVLLIGLVTCIYCCCCRSGSNRAKMDREELEYARKKAERQVRRGRTKAERKAKNDEIRRKYGLLKNEEEDSYTELTEHV
ncbi:pituitary tumor-transforming gene 1 protein-interacting protein-like isoform X2 [Acanthaster planci]|uniref:Pituitary tumor-transforming gene 1 protein-interacting protein-like isoform X2 n=1 Tax=Acanthaster planci TaxID=133434 RepID=A0A8B7XGC7_ACAPL|nr:pituitary tumor-transforming gene 1 protein-interacting protein-like isoform X2 [Acanthaster planci]